MRQKLLIFALSVAVILGATACVGRDSDPMGYINSPFSAELNGVMLAVSGERVEFSARLLVFDRVTEGERGFELTFTSPQSLSGLSVRRATDGGVTLSSLGLEMKLKNGEALSRFIKIAEMLIPDGEIVGISSISGSSVGLWQYEKLTKIETDFDTVYLDPKTSYPVRAELSDAEGELSFESVILNIL